ncbi:MAG: cytochrome B6 [Gammaproteobacteria bacterium]|nr:MAG: cytochrome B6 [Gammaproteobacteria bacterium]
MARGALLLACLALPLVGWAQHVRNEPILPIPRPTGLDPEKVALGQRLFFDTRLSRDQSISCVSCHRMALGGTDEHVPSLGVAGRKGGIKSPTVFNSDFNIAQFWDGRARDLHEQLDGPVHNPVEMDNDWPTIVHRLQADEAFRARFLEAYPQGINEAALKDALVQFERSLVTPDSPFDRWLKGDEKALSTEAREGYALFQSYGCVACHQGVNVGGNLFQRMGVMGDYFKDRGTPTTRADLGRFNVTGDEEDKFYFKVPSLRLVALQKRFFHDGSAATLDEAIQTMARYQLGRTIPPTDRARIMAFLRSLVGHHPLLPES